MYNEGCLMKVGGCVMKVERGMFDEGVKEDCLMRG